MKFRINQNQIICLLAIAGLLLLGVYLLRLHYVQDYSDPVGFVRRAEQWASVGDHEDRAPLYPIILYGFMQVIGRDWVFVANIPYILLMLLLLGVCTETFFEKKPPYPDWVRWAAILIPGNIFFWSRLGLLHQMVNPYREPIALFLLLAVTYFFVRSWRHGSFIGMCLTGVVLGLCTSIRETSLLLVLPLGIWSLGEMWRRRKLVLGLSFIFGAGLILGLLPLLIKNYQYSGSSLVPAYAAGDFAQYMESETWDIPIPGMSLKYFRSVAPTMLDKFIKYYTLWGGAFFCVGIAGAFVRRCYDIILLYTPAFFTYLIFYSFYNRYLGRYAITAEIFAVPIIAYGIIVSLIGLEKILANVIGRRIRMLHASVCVCLLLVFLLRVLPPILRGNERTKVWNLETIRRELLAVIDEPAVFMGNRHFCYRMSWLLDQSFWEFSHSFQMEHMTTNRLADRLRGYGELATARFAEGNYYIDSSSFSLASQWLQRDPIFDFSDLSVTLERYGNPLSGDLHKVTLWQQNETEFSLDRPRSASSVLMLDMGRPWDYPFRTQLKGLEPSVPDVVYSLTNGVQFLALGENALTNNFLFEISSDAPVKKAPYWRLIDLGDDITVSFGMGDDHWAWNYASDSLYPNRFIPYDSAQLYDAGKLRVPYFAQKGHDVFAEVRLEFVRSGRWHSEAHTLEMESDVLVDSWFLPPARHQGRFVIPVGVGDGQLRETTLHLQTSLPSHDTQRSIAFEREYPHNAYVKVCDVRIFSRPPVAEYPVFLNVGGDDAYGIGSGFHKRERSGSKTGRWTSGNGKIRINALSSLPQKIRVEVLPIRPPEFENVDVTFTLNGRAITDTSLVLRKGESWVYDLVIDSSLVPEKDWLELVIISETWNPAEEGLGQDRRDLGLFVDCVELF